jgi:hypothetical protein
MLFQRTKPVGSDQKQVDVIERLGFGQFLVLADCGHFSTTR